MTSDSYSRNEYGELATYAFANSGLTYPVTYDDGTSDGSRDGLGRVRRKSQTRGVGVSDYQYDEQGRLWTVTQNQVLAHTYLYDSNGNRLSDDPAGDTVASYDGQDHLLSYNGTTYQYGPNGDLQLRTRPNGSADVYEYDALGNLTHVDTEWGHAVDYQVDAFGRRTLKKLDGTLRARYIYGRGLGPVAVLDANNQLAARFVYGSRSNVPDLMVLSDGTVLRFVCDQLGSPIMLVNVANGVVAQITEYDDFGATTQSAGADVPNFLNDFQPFGFAGGMYDADTGLVRFGARDYDPEVGRWTSKDPLLFGGAQANLYVYAGNDPVNRIDSNGECVQIAAGAVIGAAINLVAYVALTSTSDTTWAGVGGAVVGGAVSGASAASGVAWLAPIGGAVGYLGEAALSGQGWTGEGLLAAALGNTVGAGAGEMASNKLLQLSENYALARGSLLVGRSVAEEARRAEAEAVARGLGGSTAIALATRWADQLASPPPCPTGGQR